MNLPVFGPGTSVMVGGQTLTVEKPLAKGTYGQVYLARATNGVLFVLKRCLYDQKTSTSVQMELECYKRIYKHPKIVRMYAHATRQVDALTAETLLVFEYCPGGTLLDLMNSRLGHRLMEQEILKILTDILHALVHLHSMSPPILHRDLKVENVLVAGADFKLCDFGSATARIVEPSDLVDLQRRRAVEEELDRLTTPQYRAPEMYDLSQGKRIDAKGDIWALGILLYKLCYYKTPFEESGQAAIVQARYTIPNLPRYTPKMLYLIEQMLQKDPQKRPTAQELLKQIQPVDVITSGQKVLQGLNGQRTISTYIQSSKDVNTSANGSSQKRPQSMMFANGSVNVVSGKLQANQVPMLPVPLKTPNAPLMQPTSIHATLNRQMNLLETPNVLVSTPNVSATQKPEWDVSARPVSTPLNLRTDLMNRRHSSSGVEAISAALSSMMRPESTSTGVSPMNGHISLNGSEKKKIVPPKKPEHLRGHSLRSNGMNGS